MELTEKAREMRNAYQREQYKKNKQKNKERMIDYWNRKAAEQDEDEQKSEPPTITA